MGMPQTTNTATATAVWIRSHTALLTTPAIRIQSISNLRLHEGQLHASKHLNAQPTRQNGRQHLTRSDADQPHLMTESTQPQTTVNSSTQDLRAYVMPPQWCPQLLTGVQKADSICIQSIHSRPRLHPWGDATPAAVGARAVAVRRSSTALLQ